MSNVTTVADFVGNTPLIPLRKASEQTGCTILGKAEFMNPGQSVKDRAALFMIRDAERKGTLKPGGTIVEGTAGNTGIGLTVIGNALGYRSVIVIPETQSQEKKTHFFNWAPHWCRFPRFRSRIRTTTSNTPPGLQKR